jgi:ethanolamine phosphate transferase 2 subunit G
MSVIAEATFPLAFDHYSTTELCRSKPSQDVERLACAWREAEHAYRDVQVGAANAAQAMSFIQSFLTDGQDMLSGTASNYNLDKMYIGIGIVAVGVVLGAMSVPWAGKGLTLGSSAYGMIMLTYGVTMFASSYVEEEQQFWYWALAGWLIALHSKE